MTEVSKPKEVTDFEEEEESTTKDVMHVFKCLKRACEREGKVHYFTFLVDPMSFAHTVENMFHFAFLIKVRGLVCLVEEGRCERGKLTVVLPLQDGRAGVEMGEDGQPYICLRML